MALTRQFQGNQNNQFGSLLNPGTDYQSWQPSAEWNPYISTGNWDDPGLSGYYNADVSAYNRGVSAPKVWAQDPTLSLFAGNQQFQDAITPALGQLLDSWSAGDASNVEPFDTKSYVTPSSMYPKLFEAAKQYAPDKIPALQEQYKQAIAREKGNFDQTQGGFWNTAGDVMDVVAPIMMSLGLGAMGAGIAGPAVGAAVRAGTSQALSNNPSAMGLATGLASGLAGPAISGLGGAAAGTAAETAASTGGNAMDWSSLFDEWSPAVTDAYGGAGDVAASGFDPSWFDEWSPAATDAYGGPGFDPAWADEWSPAATDAYGGPGVTPGGSTSNYNSTAQRLLRFLTGDNAGGGAGGGAGGAGRAGGLLGALGGGSPLGALLGGLAGGMDGSKQAGVTSITTEPWGPQQPYLMDLFNRARMQADQSATQFPAGADQAMADTIAGKYLSPSSNPYLDQTFNQARDQVGASIDSRFAGASRYGSGAHQGVLGNTFNNLANQIYGGNYQQERQRQNAAVLAAPEYTTAKTQAQFAPLQQYAGAVRGGYGGTTNTPYYKNRPAGILSGALAGSRLFK